MLELFMFFWGVVIICSGKFKIGYCEIEGKKARICGFIYTAPLPIYMIICMICSLFGYVPGMSNFLCK